MEQEKTKYVMYDANNSGINGQIIGQVLYSGMTSKGSLTDGKIYDCIGLSFGELRIIDDSGEAFYYHAKPSWKDKTAQFIAVKDDSPNKIMSAFLNGDESRTPYEKKIEKEYIVGMSSLSLNREGHVNKSKSKQIGLVKKTPEQVKYRNSLFEQFARCIADDVIKGATALKENHRMFDSPIGTEFNYMKGENSYRVKREENCWQVSKIAKVKKAEVLSYFCTLPDNLKDISEVKVFMTNNDKF